MKKPVMPRIDSFRDYDPQFETKEQLEALKVFHGVTIFYHWHADLAL